MKTLLPLLPACAALALAATAIAAEPPPTQVIQIDRAKIAEAAAHGGALLENSLFKIQESRRVVPGFVEIHTHDTDIFHVLEGSATFLTGGTPVDPKPAGPGEIRAKSMIGGVEHHLTKGDIIVIPHGIPHQYIRIDQAPFRYFVVKVTQ